MGLADREEGLWVAFAIDAVVIVRERVARVIESIARGSKPVAGNWPLEAKRLLAEKQSAEMRRALGLSGIPVFLLAGNRKGCRNRQPFSFFIL
jgi:hypothetical protein